MKAILFDTDNRIFEKEIDTDFDFLHLEQQIKTELAQPTSDNPKLCEKIIQTSMYYRTHYDKNIPVYKLFNRNQYKIKDGIIEKLFV